jgi:exosortase A-associated hydrolase 1
MNTETPISFRCGDADLVGMIHQPDSTVRRGVLIVVGGPQYRTGSHRQFLLMARALAENGIAAMRFDYRGLGDSGGTFPGFENIDDDIRAATDAFCAEVPELEEIVLWGLCDAASAILFYAHRDPRIMGSVLLNPWVRSEGGYAKTQLRHYYLQRLFSRELWGKILRGRFDLSGSAGSLLGTVKAATGEDAANEGSASLLTERMANGLRMFKGQVLLIMSGNDLTAREFDEAIKTSRRWQDLVSADRLTRIDMAAADHTFSRRGWRDDVATATIEWIREQQR